MNDGARGDGADGDDSRPDSSPDDDGSPDRPEVGFDVIDRAFRDYTEKRAREACQEEEPALPEVGDDELVLLDAAPTCELSRLGLDDAGSRQDLKVVERASVADEPTFALCSCGEFEASNRIEAPGQSDIIGDVGANGDVFGSAPFRLDGVLIGGREARLDNRVELAELRLDGTLTASNEVDIAGDAVVGGLDIPGERVSVGGTLTVPSGTDLSSVESTGDIVNSPAAVPAPCDCSRAIDYDELRRDFRDVDDDGQDDFDDYDADIFDDDDYVYPAPPALLNGLDESRTVYLPCGTYYFDSIEVAQELTLVAVGAVEVFVDGDVDVAGPLVLETTEKGSLDFFVAGRFEPSNTVRIGRSDEPDAVRLYVRDHWRTAGPVELHGRVYAPEAPFIADNTFQSDGAAFAGRFDFAAPVTITDGPRFTRDACLLWDEADANLVGADDDDALDEEVGGG